MICVQQIVRVSKGSSTTYRYPFKAGEGRTEICKGISGICEAATALSDDGSRKTGVSAFQEYVELHQRYLVKGEDVLNEWHMEKIRRRTNSMNLHGPYVGPPDKQKVCLPFPAFLL